MKIIKPQAIIEEQFWEGMLRRIEEKGRVCYKSEKRIGEDSAKQFIQSLAKNGHLSVLEHASISVKFTADRGLTHEIVRHRIGAYSQESTRYCNYGSGISFIEPFFFKRGSLNWTAWKESCASDEKIYEILLSNGATPEQARTVLPNSLKTELWATYNLHGWRHFFEARAARTAHPQMRQVVIPLLFRFKEILPVVFADLPYDKNFPQEHYAEVKIG